MEQYNVPRSTIRQRYPSRCGGSPLFYDRVILDNWHTNSHRVPSLAGVALPSQYVGARDKINDDTCDNNSTGKFFYGISPAIATIYVILLGKNYPIAARLCPKIPNIKWTRDGGNSTKVKWICCFRLQSRFSLDLYIHRGYLMRFYVMQYSTKFNKTLMTQAFTTVTKVVSRTHSNIE